MKSRLKSKGWGPFRQDWYSVCSMCYYHNEDCPRCRVGRWHNRLTRKFGSMVYRLWPDLWRWWANRPAGKRDLQKLLKEIREGNKHGQE